MEHRLERERMEHRLCEAAIEGNEESLLEIIGQDRFILSKFGVGYSQGCPLHLAASRGHTLFVRILLEHNPELTEVLDSQLRSALHLASAKGHIEIVQALVNVSPEMCLARDRDGTNPVHVAAMKGKVEVLDELIRVCPQAARARVDRGGTILHLCVKYNQLVTLQKLLEKIKGQDFVNAKDDDGNTVLHLAVEDKNVEIVKDVLQKSKIDVNAINASGHTAMDVLFQAESNGTESDEPELIIEDFLREAKAKRAKDLVKGEWLTKKRDALMVVASLIATMAFQAGVNPPGGVWQNDSVNTTDHRAGEAVMAYNYPAPAPAPAPGGVYSVNSTDYRAGEAVMAYHYPDSYPYFLRSNTIGFVASLSTILLLISGLPFRKRAFMWILVVIMWLTITAMAFTYAFSIVVVTPKKYRKTLSHTIMVAVIVWCSVMALLLLVHTLRLIANGVKEQRRRDKAIERIFKFGTGRGRSRRRPSRTSTNPVYANRANSV